MCVTTPLFTRMPPTQSPPPTHAPFTHAHHPHTSLNKLIRVLVALGFSQPELVHRLTILLSSYCIYLGHTYTHTVVSTHPHTHIVHTPPAHTLCHVTCSLLQIVPFFEVCLKLPSQNAGSALAEGHTKVTTPVLAAYLAGVLSTFTKVTTPTPTYPHTCTYSHTCTCTHMHAHTHTQDEKLLCGYLRSTVVDLALYFAPVDSLRTSLLELKRDRKLHPLVLSVLQELANHSSFQVRRYVAILYGVSVRV